MAVAVYLMLWYLPYMPRKALPQLGPSPTPITEYLLKHPEASMMSLAKASGLHYDTIHKAEQGLSPPALVTVLKLGCVGIPIEAWKRVPVIQRLLETNVDPAGYTEKQRRWREKRA